MATKEARGIDLELIERRPEGFVEQGPEDRFIVPNLIRINGTEVMASASDPIKFSNLEVEKGKGITATAVTVTLFCRSVSIRSEQEGGSDA